MMIRLYSLCGVTLVAWTLAAFATADEPIAIGDRRELFVDDYMVDSMTNVELKVHEPVRRNVAIKFDKPWEGNGCKYISVFPDGDTFRMYYHAWQIKMGGPYPTSPIVIAYAESRDGIHWTRPNLGLVEFQGSKDNNILMKEIKGTECHDFQPFIDTNPKATPDAKYKAISFGHGYKPFGICAYKSPDGIHWTLMNEEQPVFTKGHFDTQNIAFWSEHEKQYVMYFRYWSPGTRNIGRAVSDDFIHWTRTGYLDFGDDGPTRKEQFYTNQIKPYYRAPHILIGFPARFVDNGLTESTYQLPEPEERKLRVDTKKRWGTVVTDSILITSRDGKKFQRANDVFLRPGLRTRHNWSYGDNFISWHVIETAPTEDDTPRELSLFATESLVTGNTCRLRRYTLRLDGFVSAHARRTPGEVVTKPLTFQGNRLSLNFGTSAAGTVKIELQDAEGKPIPGFTEADSDLIYGDSLDRTVGWKGKTDVSTLADKPIRIKFLLVEADVYSWKFEK